MITVPRSDPLFFLFLSLHDRDAFSSLTRGTTDFSYQEKFGTYSGIITQGERCKAPILNVRKQIMK